MESAFVAHPYVIKSAQDHHSGRDAAEILLLREATSLRQMSEWGMRAFQASFPRTKATIHYEERGERGDFLLTIVLLFNYRAAKVGMNQIQSTFMPELNLDPIVHFNVMVE